MTDFGPPFPTAPAHHEMWEALVLTIEWWLLLIREFVDRVLG